MNQGSRTLANDVEIENGRDNISSVISARPLSAVRVVTMISNLYKITLNIESINPSVGRLQIILVIYCLHILKI